MFSEGNCKGAITYRSYWSRIDPTITEPVEAGVNDGNAVDLNDAAARYSRMHHVPKTVYVEVGMDAEKIGAPSAPRCVDGALRAQPAAVDSASPSGSRYLRTSAALCMETAHG